MTNATLLSDFAISVISHGYTTIIRKMVSLKVRVVIQMIKDQYVKMKKTVELPIIDVHLFQKNKWAIEFLSIVRNHNLSIQFVDNPI